MKRSLLILGVCCLIAISSFGQKRTCSTMQYYEMNQQKSPELELKMMEDEKKIMDWIKQHPVNSEESKKIQWPSIPGFISTGIISVDRVAYEKAKEEYLDYTGFHQQHMQIDQAASNIMRKQKRKTHSFIIK